jgi:hypothetical protein
MPRPASPCTTALGWSACRTRPAFALEGLALLDDGRPI